MKISLGKISELIGATLIGNPEIEIDGIGALNKATSHQVSYFTQKKYLQTLTQTKAGAVIIHQEFQGHCPTNSLVVTNPYLAFAKLSHAFKQANSVHQNTNSAVIDSTAQINNASIGPGCVIGKNVCIGEDCIIEVNCIIEDNVTIGKNSHIFSNAVIHKDCILGNSCIISSGAIIGSEGFGNARNEDKTWQSIAHLGRVALGNDVSIGANTTIDRGTIEDTEIHNGVRIDNLVHIAHNVIIGEHTAIAAKTGIAGSTKIGKRCMIGGMVGIVGHLSITDDVTINATSTVDKNITKSGMYTGFFPLMRHKSWQKVGMWLIKLDKIIKVLQIKLKDIK